MKTTQRAKRADPAPALLANHASDLLDSPFGFSRHLSREEARATGKALRKCLPRSALQTHVLRSPQVALDIVLAGNAGRLDHLVPLRMRRMAASPFAFFRGAAAVMAHDLDNRIRVGVGTQLCGDAHVSNFGFYASPERRVAMDLNDFDETAHGPFECDLQRLAGSVIVAARTGSVSKSAASEAAVDAIAAYRRMMRKLSRMPVLAAWHFSFDDNFRHAVGVKAIEGLVENVLSEAASNTSAKVVSEWTTRNGTEGWCFVEEPPVLTCVQGKEREAMEASLVEYAATLSEERRALLGRFVITDVAFRVVGVGSVGTRAYIALLHGNADDPLILQIKEARPTVLARMKDCHVAADGEHDGRRVVHGVKIMQTVSDPFLGWTTIDGCPFFVRTFRDMKGGVDVAKLKAGQFDDYARLCGALLARAHARSADARVLAAYLGRSEAFDEAMLKFAIAYADQTEADHAALAHAIKSGKVAAAPG